MRRLCQDFSCDELLYLREEKGMTNREIAEYTGSSYQSVYKMIGRQPKGLRKCRDFDEPSSPEKVSNDDLPATLIVGDRTISLTGEIGEYIIKTSSQEVSIRIPSYGIWKEQTVEAVKVSELHNIVENLKTLTGELETIERKSDSLKFTNELW